MGEWAESRGAVTWERGQCSNPECGHQQSVKVILQYGCAQVDRETCDECGAPLELEGE